MPFIYDQILEDSDSDSSSYCDLADNLENYEDWDLIQEWGLIDNSEIVTEWLPAEPIDKTIFTGYITYIDDNGIVHLHDGQKHDLVERIRKEINQNLEFTTERTTVENLAVGQPCLARYHLDNYVYRAVINRTLPNNVYEVRFVDYGNIETCEQTDLYWMTVFPNIPIQANRYTIDGIKPRNEQEKFSTLALDVIHSVVVGKLCGIRVIHGEQDKEIKKCNIRLDGNDIATYMIDNGFASEDELVD